MKKRAVNPVLRGGNLLPALGGTYNIAPKARATASSSLNADGDASESQRRLHPPRQCGRMGIGSADALLAAITLPLIRLRLGRGGHPLAHRPLRPADGDAHTAGGDLFFSDGTRIGVVGIPDNGEPKVVEFAPKRVRWVKFEVNDAVGSHVGLSGDRGIPTRRGRKATSSRRSTRSSKRPRGAISSSSRATSRSA